MMMGARDTDATVCASWLGSRLTLMGDPSLNDGVSVRMEGSAEAMVSLGKVV